MSVNEIFSQLLSLEVRKDISFIKSFKEKRNPSDAGSGGSRVAFPLHAQCLRKCCICQSSNLNLNFTDKHAFSRKSSDPVHSGRRVGASLLHFPTNSEWRTGTEEEFSATPLCTETWPCLDHIHSVGAYGKFCASVSAQRLHPCENILTELRCTLSCQILSFIQKITSFEADTFWKFPHSVNPCTCIFSFNGIGFPVFNSFLALCKEGLQQLQLLNGRFANLPV